MSKCALIFATLLGTALAVTAQGVECARYEPAVTEISGKLVLRDYPGPPNFESIEAGDQPEPA